MQPDASRPRYLVPFAVVTTLFFMWGFITVLVDALVPRLRDVFELTYFQAALVQFAFFGAYLLVSIPGGTLITRIGYKRGIVVGLLTMGVGCLLFYPAAGARVYVLFLLALFVLASGITILQVAANPYVAALGPPESAPARLNLAQAFNSLGTTIAPLVSAAFILGTSVMSTDDIGSLSESARAAYYAAEASAVQAPFVWVAGALIVLALAIGLFKLPAILDDNGTPEGGTAVLRHRHLVLGAVGIFVYVGAEVTIGSYLVDYFLNLDFPALVAASPVMQGIAGWLSGSDDLSGFTPQRLAGTFVAFYWGGAMVGRFLGALILRVVPAGRLLALYAGVVVLLLLGTMATAGLLSVWTILAIGLFNSIMFPTIFTLAIDGLGDLTAQGSGVLCASIFGGAVIPPLYGLLADSLGLTLALVVPVLCYLYILYYGLSGHRRGKTAGALA